METSIHTFQIQLSRIAHVSFVTDLRANGVKFTPITMCSLIVKNTPKVRMAIQLVKERFGRECIYITNAEC
jgi:hypothetical protein